MQIKEGLLMKRNIVLLELIILVIGSIFFVGCKAQQSKVRKMLDQEIQKYNPTHVSFDDKNGTGYSHRDKLEYRPMSEDYNSYFEMVGLQNDEFTKFLGKEVDFYYYDINGLKYNNKTYDRVSVNYIIYDEELIGGYIMFNDSINSYLLSLDLDTFQNKHPEGLVAFSDEIVRLMSENKE